MLLLFVLGGRGRHESLAHQAQPYHRHDQGEPGYAEGVVNTQSGVYQTHEYGTQHPGGASGSGHQTHPQALGTRTQHLAEDRLHQGHAHRVADRGETVADHELEYRHPGCVATPLLAAGTAQLGFFGKSVQGLVVEGCQVRISHGDQGIAASRVYKHQYSSDRKEFMPGESSNTSELA